MHAPEMSLKSDPRRLRRLAGGCLALALVGIGISPAKGAAYLKIDDIAGEATATGYEGWIEVEAFAAGLEAEGTGAGATRTRGTPVPDNFEISKRLDAASPYLLLAALQQQVLPEVQFEASFLGAAEGAVLVRQVLSNARVVGLRTATGEADDGATELPRETVEFDFEEWSSHTLRAEGEVVSASWNFLSDTGGFTGVEAPARPVLAPLDVLAVEPGQAYAVRIQLSDADTPVEALTVEAESLDPAKVTVIGWEGTGAQRTLTFWVSELFSGSAAVRLRVSDGFQSSGRTLMLSIEGGDTPYEAFLAAAFGAAVIEDPVLGLPIGDPDKDGLKTIAEFYLGTDPRLFTPRDEAIEVRPVEGASGRQVHLRFFRRVDTPGLIGRFFLSANLQNWTELSAESSPPLVETGNHGGQPYEEVEARLDLPAEGWESVFLRLEVLGIF